MTPATVNPPQFVDLLSRALSEPGVVSRAYSAFHGYSIGNQLLALMQCAERGIPPGPIATFMGWKEKGRYVRKGEKAITLCQPVTAKRKPIADRVLPADGTESAADQHSETFTRFIYRPHWFVLSQTDGADVEPMPIPTWDRRRALDTLGVAEEPFSSTDGNCQGYARQRTIAVSPVAELPHKTRFHELAHVVLGHTSEAEAGLSDSDLTPRSLREVEAEAVALVCLEALGLPGAEHCRGYIQHWNDRTRRRTDPGAKRPADLQGRRSDPEGRHDGRGGAVMTPDDGSIREVVDELANALQTGLLLAGKLATGLRADAHDADVLYQAITRATAALQRLRPKGSAR